MALLRETVEGASATFLASADKINAIGSTNKTLGKQLEDFKGSTADDISTLRQKVGLSTATGGD